MEYSYNDGSLYYFMDQETYELEPIDGSILDDSFKFVKENDDLHHHEPTRARSSAWKCPTL